MSIDHLSYSSIRQYIDCSLGYKFKKIDCIKPEFISDNLIFGSCMHKTLAKFNQHRAREKPTTFHELGDWFEEYFSGAVTEKVIKYSNGHTFKSCLHLGRNLLKIFHEQYPADAYGVLDIEHEFNIEVDGLPCPIIGYIDLIEQDEEGQLILTEYKTSGRSYSTNQIDCNDQVTLYHLAAQTLSPTSSIINKIDCLIKTKIPKFEIYYTYRDHEDHNRFLNVAKQVAKGIDAAVYIPNTNGWKCNYCEYQTTCKEWLNSNNGGSYARVK